MASQHSHTFRWYPRGAIFLSLVLAVAVAAHLQAQQSPVNTRTADPPRKQKEQAAPLDRYGDVLPPGAKARLGMLWLQRDTGGQRACFGLSPDGKTIVTFSHGRRVKLWDAGTGNLREQRELPVKFFFDPCLSSDGRLLEGTGAVEDKIMMFDIWDIRAGKPLQRLRRPRLLAIHQKGFSPDAKMFATATGFGNIIDLWDIASGKRRELRGNAFAFSPDSKRLASLDGRSVLLWDASTGELIWQQETRIHEHAKVAFTFTPDGRTLIAAPHFVEHAWHAWDAATGKAAEGLKLPDKNQADDLAVAPDGRTLVFVHHRNVYVAPQGYRRIRLWDLRAGKFLSTLPASGDIGPFFPDGKSFLTNDGALQRWDLATGRPMFAESYKLGHQASVFRAIYSPDGRRLASADREGTVRLWDVATTKTLHILRGHGRHFSMAFTPDGKYLITGAIEGKLHVWDAENGKLVRRILLRDLRDKDKDRPVWRLQVTPDGRTLLVLEYNPNWPNAGAGVLSRWNLATGERKARAEIKANLIASAFSSDGQMLVAGKELLDTATLKRRALLEEKQPSEFGGCYALSADGRTAAGLLVRRTQKEDKEERMHTITTLEGYQTWETATGKTRRRILLGNQGEYQLSSGRHYEEDMPLALSPDGRYLAAVDAQGLRVWDLTAAGKVVLKRPVTDLMRDNAMGGRFACCLCFSPDGRTLATGNVDSTILIWNLPQAQEPPAKTPTKERARKPEKLAASIDRYGDALPPGAKARLGTGGLHGSSRRGGTRFGLTPDGKTIVTFSHGRRVKLWDADTGNLREQRELPVKLPFDGCLSADGRLLAGSERDYDTPLDFWDVHAGKRVQRIPLPKRFSFFSPVVSPDGKLLAAEGSQNIIYLWDIASGRRRELTGKIFVFSPDGKRLASADKHRVVCWNTSTGEPIWQKEIGIFDDMWITLAFSPDGRILIAAPHHDKDAWHVWDAATGRVAQGLKLPVKYQARDLAVAPDGRTLVFHGDRQTFGHGDERGLRIWDLRAGKLLHKLPTKGRIGPFFPDGKSFLSNDGALQRWELATGRPMFAESYKLGHQTRVIQLVYSPDGRRLASAAFDGTIRLWDVAQSKTLHILRGHRRNHFSMAFTPDGKFLVTGAIEGKVHIWDVETGKLIRRIPLRGPEDKDKDVHVRRLQVTADGRSLLVLEYDPQRQPAVLSRWNPETGERKTRDEFNADLTASVFSPDGRTLAAGRELLDAATLKSRVLLEENPMTKLGGCYAFSADGRLATGLITRQTKGGDAPTTPTTVVALQIWETATGRTRRCIPLDNPRQFRFTKITFNGNVPLALSPDGRYVAAADVQGLWVWEVASGKVVLQRPIPASMRENAVGEPFACCLCFSPDGRTLATGNVDSTLLIWDLPQAQQPPAKTPTHEPARKSEPQAASIDRSGDRLPEGAVARLGTVWVQGSGMLARAAFGLSPDGKTIITFTKSRSLKIRDANTGKLRERRELPLEFPFVAYMSADGRLLAGQERGLFSKTPLDVWDIPTGKRLQRLRPTKESALDDVIFSPDGKWLAATAAENVFYLWEIASGRSRELKGAGPLVFSPDAKRLLATDGESVICWDTSKAEQLWRKKIGLTPYERLRFAFTPDGRTVIAAPNDKKRPWHALDAATGKVAEGLKLPEKQQANDLAVASDGRTLLFVMYRGYGGPGADRRIRIWDLRQGKLLHTLPVGGDIGPFFPDGKSFLSNDGAVQRWELATGRPLLADSRKIGHQKRVFRLVYSPDGRFLASAGRDQTVRLWDVATAKPLHVLAGHNNVAFSMDFTPDGKRLVTGAIEDKLHIWDTKTGKVVRRIPLHDPKDKDKNLPVWRLRVTPDGRTILVLEHSTVPVIDAEGRHLFRNGFVSRWDLASGERKARDESPSSLTRSALSPDGRLLVAGIEVLDTATTQRRTILRQVSKFGGCYAISANGRLAAGIIMRMEEDERRRKFLAEGVQIWEAATGQTVRCLAFGAKGEFRFTPLGFEGIVPLALSPDGRYVAAADLQGLWVWELASGRVALHRPNPASMRDTAGEPFACWLAFAPDGRTLATGNIDSTILIWNLPQAR